jgi:hypothetical protein
MNEDAIEWLGLDPVAPILIMIDEITVSTTKIHNFSQVFDFLDI